MYYLVFEKLTQSKQILTNLDSFPITNFGFCDVPTEMLFWKYSKSYVYKFWSLKCKIILTKDKNV